jgi:DNA-directed RNA polymerase
MNPQKYLSERVSKILINSDKFQNEGARLLAHSADWESNLDTYINEAWDSLVKYCTRNKSSTHSASVKLTFASDLIGKRIAKSIDADPTDIKTTLSLGDLMLETFLQDGLIDIIKEYDGFKAPYVVRVVNMTDSVKPTLIGTSFEPLPPISGLYSPLTNNPFIKGWTDSGLFKNYLNQTFVKSLETLRQQPWVLNQPVLAAIREHKPPELLELVDTDGEIHYYNIHQENLRLPKKLTHMDGTQFLGKKDPKLQRMLSKYFEYNQIVKKAQLVENKTFYQEVSCDYRGRVYYAESFLEFQGSDLSRSLFLFGNKKRVTEKGYYWLAIHAASCFNQSYSLTELKELHYLTTDYIGYLEKEGLDSISVDKMTLDDRTLWVKNNLKFIIHTARTKSIIDTAEKPYSFLAVCIEIAGYHKAKVLKQDYYSGLPVPIDGSNNGTQHLAAMSKDAYAGALVSLTPTDIQKDFYVAVAKELITLAPEWFAEKNMPMKHIRKGIAKRGCMTRSYSAGRKRIAKNMYEDCHMEGYTSRYSITEDDCDMLAGKLIDAINNVCTGPLKTMKYLQKVAAHELDCGRNQMSWHTPSGFPVVYKAFLQQEWKQRGTIKGIQGNKDGRVMHVVKVNVNNQETGAKVPCKRSFASGISPNVIHSYDAAHMANTIVAFNGSFGAVHDSFSTHADEVDFLQEVTKQTFIAQYDVDNFFDIIQDTLMLNKDTFEYPQPKLGALNLSQLTDSKYFFC